MLWQSSVSFSCFPRKDLVLQSDAFKLQWFYLQLATAVNPLWGSAVNWTVKLDAATDVQLVRTLLCFYQDCKAKKVHLTVGLAEETTNLAEPGPVQQADFKRDLILTA